MYSRSLLSLPALLLLIGLTLLSSCSDDDSTTPQVLERPEVLGQDVSGVDHQGVTLGGWINGHGRPTVCWFDYGDDTSFGERTPDLDAGAVSGSVRVEYNLTGLDPGRDYWWRLVAVAGDDTAFAADTTFTTLVVPNDSPLTHVSHPPLENNPVSFYWTGSDNDGVVIGYRWRMSDNGLDLTIDEPDTLGLPWNFTTATDSVFAVSADQPGVLPDPDGTGRPRFGQFHTFWIKAVDNLGAEDPTPAFISFSTLNEAPEVIVAVSPTVDPTTPGCTELSLPVIFSWTALDPDGPQDDVLQVRTLLVSLSDLGIVECLTEAEYEALDPLAGVNEELWGDWQEYQPSAYRLSTFELGPQHEGGRYLFAAMARDGAGAWTQELAWGINVWQVEILPD